MAAVNLQSTGARRARCSDVGVIASALLLLQSGCTVLAIADAATSVAVTTVKVGVKAVSTAVDAVTPNSDKDKK
jgi:hypothetical protein